MLQAMRPAVRKALVLLALIVLAPVAAWKLLYPTFTYRYRLTVEAEVDGEVRRGSSVIEVSFHRKPSIANIPWSSRTTGQAAAVDLGSKGVLVWLPGGGENVSAPFLFLRAFPHYASQPTSFPADRAGLLAIAVTSLNKTLQAGNLPGFAWLPDRNDRTSAKPVYPKQLPWDVAPGIRILSVRIETTDAPLTRDLSKVLPWLATQYKSRDEGYSRGNEFLLMAMDLSMGMEP